MNLIASQSHVACTKKKKKKTLTWDRNDAVVPVVGTYAGCEHDDDGLCSFDNVVSVLQQRIEEIDYDYDCYANYTATAGFNYNGRAPK